MSAPSPSPRFDLDRLRAATGRDKGHFWSSLEELLDEDGFRQWLADEFPAAASLFDEPGRRQFLKLMGASLLLAGVGGCGPRAADEAAPYANQPETFVPGVPRYFATAVLFEGFAQPVIATTYSGRPTKLDGNPDHPATPGGASDIFMQNAVLDLYDPERAQGPTHEGVASSWTAFTTVLAGLRSRWHETRGEGLRILTGATTSPTLTRQFAALAAQYPRMRWHRYEAADGARGDAAMRLAFGRPVVPHYRLDRCDVIVSLDHDLLGPGAAQVMHAHAWASRRGEVPPGSGRSRLHVAEPVPTLTGTVATTRLPCDPSRLCVLMQAIANEFGIDGWTMPELSTAERAWTDLVCADLRGNAGRSLLTVGPHVDPSRQAVAALVNARLTNVDATVWYTDPIAVAADEASTLTALTSDMAAGSVDTLITVDCNPAYTAPGGLSFADYLARVTNRIHLGLHADETAAKCDWALPLSHPLESWSDARAVDGTATIIQPVVAPLYASRSVHQFIDMLLGASDPPADGALRATWQERFNADFEERWSRALHDGFVADTAAVPLSLSPQVPAPNPSATSDGDALEVVFQTDPTVWDGRFANVAWLQELPKPLTKTAWDNVIGISPAIAAGFGLSNGDLIDVEIGGRRARGAAWVVPGQAKRTVALTFGYGRSSGGNLAEKHGYDAHALRHDETSWAARGTLHRIAGTYPIATTQAHHRMDGFEFVREVTAEQPRTAPAKVQPTFYPDWNGADHAWGMVIDLDLCIGCNACVSACNVENNVLVVGKDQVARGREMSWLRIDRYYTGDVENPRSYFQPVPCMHCEKAPCEMGCPVHATTHSPEGVNQMVYNRCIGTRTCSSYCPYKVRRFNWYDYRRFADAEKAAKNPDVTVRSRGVMEKCTYCTQRIQGAHVTADKEGRPLRRDEVVTACQQACPTTAISFGDLKDEGSTVAQRRRSGRHYVLLEELGTRPRTTYLARWNDTPDKGGGA